MYINQIDNIIDQILDSLYLEGLTNDNTFRSIIDGKKIDYVEYRDKINSFIQKFIETIDVAQIQKLINNKENLIRILDIIKRYIAYYYFLSIAYYYAGTIKEFRNNLIQYSKLQENSTFTIKNFFDTENNYQIVKFYKMIKDVTNIITMTELQKKTLNPLNVADAIDFLNNLGKSYIDNYLLMIVTKGDERIVEINVHNLIKTIVFREIYRNQERNVVFEILNDIEEDDNEYTYIDIVVTVEDYGDYETFHQMFIGEPNSDIISRNLYELVNDSTRIPSITSVDEKNNNLLRLGILTPIVDDFLRYNRDTERLDVKDDKTFAMPLASTSNAKNVQLALLYQQRKKKENTRAQLIVNKIDAIQDYYSENVRNNQQVLNNITNYFQGPLSYRKAVTYNYLDEVHVLNKIKNQSRIAIEKNEYYLELLQAVNRAYFNFKDFKSYGTTVNIYPEWPINLLRYSNIEFQAQMSHLEVDMYTGVNDHTTNLVGLALGPLVDGPIQCTRKENLVDIRSTQLKYMVDGKVKTAGGTNGFEDFIRMIKHFYINTIELVKEPRLFLYRNFDPVIKLNPDLANKVIYWAFDPDEDLFQTDTYENVKAYNSVDTIRFMNSVVYDRIMEFLVKRLNVLIESNPDLDLHSIEELVEMFCATNFVPLKPDEKKAMIIRRYLKKIAKRPSHDIYLPGEGMVEMPEYIPTSTPPPAFRIKIDLVDPTHPQELRRLEFLASEEVKSIVSARERKCQHESEWNELIKLKNTNLNMYNKATTQFVEKYGVETLELDFVCKICGQLLPIKQYVQDGSYDNTTQKFVTSYLPVDIPLEDIQEYRKYKLIIRYLDALINQLSLNTETNMFVGPNLQVRQKRKALIKNTIDIIVKHNSVNLRKKQNDEDRLEYFAKRFNINKDLDAVYFFELDDSIIDFEPTASSVNIDENRLKYNNMLLYLVMIFITEFSGAQIAMMANNKIANIYVFFKYGTKLFGDLLIKKNINGMETVPITDYPVLCYLIFIVSYFLIWSKMWHIAGERKQKFNPYYQKIIINSFVDLFNSISMDAGRMPDDYVYMLTTSKLYTKLNSVFRDNDIINFLKREQIKYSGKPQSEAMVPVKATSEKIVSIPITGVTKTKPKPRQIHLIKVSDGINFDTPSKAVYPKVGAITDLTNCPGGTYHKWKVVDQLLVCEICGELGSEVSAQINRFEAANYYVLSKIAKRRCIRGTLHDFVVTKGRNVCTICGQTPDKVYNHEELDKLAANLDKLEETQINKFLLNIQQHRAISADFQKIRENQMQDLVDNYRKEIGDKIYGQTKSQVDKLIKLLEELIGADTNLDIDKYPVYLRDNVYVIDHMYNGTALNEPIILTEKDNRIKFRETHQFFKTDIYYYTDNKNQVDVFYHAVSLRLIGYKEKHKDFVRLDDTCNYIRISPSIMNRILSIGQKTQYIDIGKMFTANSKVYTNADENYFHIIDSLIRDHIYKIRTVVDKVAATIYKVKNYGAVQADEPQVSYLQTAKAMEHIVSKYYKLLNDFNVGPDNEAFDNWNEIRTLFVYRPIDWMETNVRATGTMYINANTIDYYDIAGSIMMYYLVNVLIKILRSNKEKISRMNIALMYVEIIVYIYSIYNIDPYKNSMQLKRFGYIMNGSNLMIDVLRRGQGLVSSKELEEKLEEQTELIQTANMEEIDESDPEVMEDLREEADALDIEGDYFMDEDQDDARMDD